MKSAIIGDHLVIIVPLDEVRGRKRGHWERGGQCGKVFELLVQGKANKEIASALNISDRTVRFHVSNILHTLGLTSRYEVVGQYSGRD